MKEPHNDLVGFVERNLIGRTVASEPITTLTNDGQTETTFFDQNLFSNLVVRAEGFSFDLTALTLGRRYGLDEKGEPAELAGSMDAVRVFRYEMTERASTGHLLGFARYVSSTNAEFDPLAGTCFLVRMWLEGDALVVQESQVGYGDFPARDERRPIASDGVYRYAVRDERLVVEYQQSTFHVDPETLERTPTDHRIPPKVSEEIGLPS